MRYFKLAKWAVSALAFLLVSSLLVGLAMTAVDFYDGLDEENEAQTPTYDPSEPSGDTEEPSGDADSSEGYVNNLSSAFGTSYVEGLFEDLSRVDSETLASDCNGSTDRSRRCNVCTDL